jgi:hypothetical protein
MVSEEQAVIQDGDVGSHGFHVRNNVRGENDDAFTGKFREQISKTHGRSRTSVKLTI